MLPWCSRPRLDRPVAKARAIANHERAFSQAPGKQRACQPFHFCQAALAQTR